MVDRATDGISLQTAWRALGQRVAVIGGSFVGLLSLLNHVPTSTAALRGGAAWAVVLIMTWLSGHALGLAQRFDSRKEPDRETGGEQRIP